jgi:uncharacterized protein (DUF1800 family)
MSIREAVEALVEYDVIVDDVDSKISKPGYVGVTARGAFAPAGNIIDARQRWLFRMLHTERPLQEKMTLFWHNHFATGFNKVQNTLGTAEGVRYMAAKASEDPARISGQIEMLRDNALGNFRDILLKIAKDVAMLVWLDGRTNFKARPQENFAREIMELFTVGVGHYTETDVYAGARVFTGWNLQRVGGALDTNGYYRFFYNAAQHDTAGKVFSFPIYTDGGKTIPARSAANGMQDGLDLIEALARHPETGRRLARKLWYFFISDVNAPEPFLINRLSMVYQQSGYNMAAVVRTLLFSREFGSPMNTYTRYSWPVEYVARALKEVGHAGFSLASALNPLSNMGQQLFEPPDVNGWDLGQSWFSTGAMLARMNFAATLTSNQRFNIGREARGNGPTPEALLSFYLDRLTPANYDRGAYDDLLEYLRTGPGWTGNDAQLAIKAPGLLHLIVGSSEYQIV